MNSRHRQKSYYRFFLMIRRPPRSTLFPTRRSSDLKGFEENYGPEIKARIGGMKPLDYTRMGPAIRHLTGILKNVRARNKLIIILSGGKPNDFDVYEGKYGIEDIKKAVLEARASGIQSFCITVDTEAREYLRSEERRVG